MAEYQVLCRGVPADFNHFKVHYTWNQSTYPSMIDAMKYAIKWAAPELLDEEQIADLLIKMNETIQPNQRFKLFDEELEIRKIERLVP